MGTLSGDPPRFQAERVGILDYGNGYAAKSADEIGRLAAMSVLPATAKPTPVTYALIASGVFFAVHGWLAELPRGAAVKS